MRNFICQQSNFPPHKSPADDLHPLQTRPREPMPCVTDVAIRTPFAPHPQPMRRGGVLPRPICRTLPVISCRAAPMCAAARHALHPQRRGTQAPRLTGVLPTPPPCPAPVGRGALTPPPTCTAPSCHASVGGGVPDALFTPHPLLCTRRAGCPHPAADTHRISLPCIRRGRRPRRPARHAPHPQTLSLRTSPQAGVAIRTPTRRTPKNIKKQPRGTHSFPRAAFFLRHRRSRYTGHF